MRALDLILRMPWEARTDELDPLLSREWLVTNGLGGYASATISGASTRSFHGMLVAALPAPFGRMMMLNHISEQIRLPDGAALPFGALEQADALHLHGAGYLIEFRLEGGLPVWLYKIQGVSLEKRLLLPHQQNTVHVTYRMVDGDGPVRLEMRPSMHIRPHEAPVSAALKESYVITASEGRYELSAGPDLPKLRMMVYSHNGSFTLDEQKITEVLYRIERSRGYQSQGDLCSPGYFSADISEGHDATIVASTEPWEIVLALTPEEAFRAEMERRRRLLTYAKLPELPKKNRPPEKPPGNSESSGAPGGTRAGVEFAAELVMAADQFIITPAGRLEDGARARAAGDEVRTVIAGYHWFTDWGRDTMISLEGLTLASGRHLEASYILRTFAHYIRDGLIPNMFPEGEKEGLYHTADATLWFFHAVDRYLETTGDRETFRHLLPKLVEIAGHHLSGTRFGIGVDLADGLLRQGQEGYQLTWMDAKMDDWVVTPRRGKAVEINALWYNALRLLEQWLREEQNGPEADRFAEHAARAQASFNQRFWYAEGGHLYDVVDGEQGDDPACRPNQLFAISLRHPVLDQERWPAVLKVVREKLYTPVGLRSLAPGHPDYKDTYFGDLRTRDAAYHQGTVWGWLIGPFVDVWLKVHPGDLDGALCFLEGFVDHLAQACIGSIGEIFDAEDPFTPRGCVAQAWSVAEVLRCWRKITMLSRK